MKWEIVSNLEGFCGMLNNASGSLEDNILLKVDNDLNNKILIVLNETSIFVTLTHNLIVGLKRSVHFTEFCKILNISRSLNKLCYLGNV